MYIILENIVVISQTSGGSRHSEVSILWQHHILRADTQLEVLVVVGHPVMDEHGQGVLVVLDLGADGEGFVAEVPETARQLLRDAVILVVVDLAAVVGHGGDVGVVVLVVVVE